MNRNKGGSSFHTKHVDDDRIQFSANQYYTFYWLKKNQTTISSLPTTQTQRHEENEIANPPPSTIPLFFSFFLLSSLHEKVRVTDSEKHRSAHMHTHTHIHTCTHRFGRDTMTIRYWEGSSYTFQFCHLQLMFKGKGRGGGVITAGSVQISRFSKHQWNSWPRAQLLVETGWMTIFQFFKH